VWQLSAHIFINFLRWFYSVGSHEHLTLGSLDIFPSKLVVARNEERMNYWTLSQSHRIYPNVSFEFKCLTGPCDQDVVNSSCFLACPNKKSWKIGGSNISFLFQLEKSSIPKHVSLNYLHRKSYSELLCRLEFRLLSFFEKKQILLLYFLTQKKNW
jgi:hypothetical protein